MAGIAHNAGEDTKPSAFVALDLSRHSLDHHLLHSSLAGEGKLEEYTILTRKVEGSLELRAEATFGHKGEEAFRKSVSFGMTHERTSAQTRALGWRGGRLHAE